MPNRTEAAGQRAVVRTPVKGHRSALDKEQQMSRVRTKAAMKRSVVKAMQRFHVRLIGGATEVLERTKATGQREVVRAPVNGCRPPP